MDGLIQTCHEYFAAAYLEADTPKGLFTTGGGTPPLAASIPVTNWFLPVITFPDSDDVYLQLPLVRLPSDVYLPGGITARLSWCTPATSGSARWQMQTGFALDGESLDAAINAVQAVVTPATAAALDLITTEFALDLTGAAPGAALYAFIERDPAHGDDDLGDAAHLVGVELIYQRRVVLG